MRPSNIQLNTFYICYFNNSISMYYFRKIDKGVRHYAEDDYNDYFYKIDYDHYDIINNKVYKYTTDNGMSDLDWDIEIATQEEVNHLNKLLEIQIFI